MWKIKKIAILLVLVVILTGCNATYNLDYTSKGIKESLLINQEIVDINEVKALYPTFPVNSDVIILEDDFSTIDKNEPLYIQEFNEINNGYQIIYSYDKLKNNDLVKSNIIKKGFSKVSNVLYKGTRQLSTSKGMLAFKAYPDLTNVTVNITTDYEVLNTNADKVNGNMYTWNFTKEDTNKNIFLLISNKVIDTSQKEEDVIVPEKVENKKEEKVSFLLLFIFISAFIVVLIVLFKFKK